MDKERWVQHISGQGEKWEVTQEMQPILCWLVKLKGDGVIYSAVLPRSEYRICDPPEEWEDITSQCTVDNFDYGPIIKNAAGANIFMMETACRIRKVQLYETDTHLYQTKKWAFIVERRKS